MSFNQRDRYFRRLGIFHPGKSNPSPAPVSNAFVIAFRKALKFLQDAHLEKQDSKYCVYNKPSIETILQKLDDNKISPEKLNEPPPPGSFAALPPYDDNHAALKKALLCVSDLMSRNTTIETEYKSKFTTTELDIVNAALQAVILDIMKCYKGKSQESKLATSAPSSLVNLATVSPPNSPPATSPIPRFMGIRR